MNNINLIISSDWHYNDTNYFPVFKLDESRRNLLIIAGDLSEPLMQEERPDKERRDVAMPTEERPDKERSGKHEQYLEVFKRLLETYKIEIIFILGNHDYFNSNIQEEINYWSKINLTRFYFLHNSILKIGNLRFLGTTLWTDLNKGYALDKGKEYFKRFEKISPSFSYQDVTNEILEENRKAVLFLQKNLRETPHENIVITHHAPTLKSLSQKFNDKEDFKYCSASDYEDLILKYQPKLWIHGHLHESFDYYLGKTRIICNARGHNRKIIIEELNKCQLNRSTKWKKSFILAENSNFKDNLILSENLILGENDIIN
jgi:Icc-related predicted phosphoesterase